MEQALALLEHPADCDECYCQRSDGCTIDTPKCSARQIKSAKRALEHSLAAPPKTLHPNRLTNPAERIFFDAWGKENKREIWLNHGFTALEWILCPEGQRVPERPSQRDAEVAATPVQWLGTSCGGAFIRECEDEISRQRAERQECEFQFVAIEFGRLDFFDRFCNRVLREIIPNPRESDGWKTDKAGLEYLRGRIKDSLQVMFAMFAYESGMVSGELCAQSACMTLERFKKLHNLAQRAVQRRKALYEKKKAEEKVEEFSS